MSEDKKNWSAEDYLKQHIGDIDVSNNTESNDDDIFNESLEDTSSKVSDLEFFTLDIKELPCGEFYPKGTTLQVRAANTREIQAYSMVDDNNFLDVIDKMNAMLSSCVRLKYPDQTIKSYLDIKDQDRLYIIFLIRELTFQKGNSLAVNKKCSCGEEVQIEIKRGNFVFHDVDPILTKYLDPRERVFNFRIKNGKSFTMTPPNIGLQKAFAEFIIKESKNEEKPDTSFLKIIPFLLVGRNNITYEGIKAKLAEYQDVNKFDSVSFQFLNSAVSKMKFGIKELKTTCKCGMEVRTKMTFPNGASGIFVIHDAFETYIEE
jgi:hypothetical protein